MYIKEVKLCGFKSYKEETVISEIYNGLNIIIGRNGSGKSNIFSGIEFALTMEFNRCMKAEARNALVYHGRTTPDAFVEIVFDNSDRKLPVNDDTVTFRRALSTKKDRFYVNRKELGSAKEFLDAAGFTNPYFIVKQGKIHELAMASDTARFKVISDVTGANAYDVKIRDCRQMIEAADGKENDIANQLAELKKRQSSLEKEVSEQKRFMQMDQAKRGIEYTLHQIRIRDIEENIDKLEKSRSDMYVRQNPIRKELEKIGKEIQKLKRNVDESEIQIKRLHDLKNEYEVSRNKYTNDLAQLNQELVDLKCDGAVPSGGCQGVALMAAEIANYETVLENADAELSSSKEMLDKLYFQKCQLNSRVNQYHETELAKDNASKRSHVLTKQNEIKKRLNDATKSLDVALDSQKVLKEQFIEQNVELQSQRQMFTEFSNDLSTINQKIQDCRAQEHKVNTRLESVLRDNSENELIFAQKRDRLSRLDDDWKKRIGTTVYDGWKGVNKIIDDFKAAGIYMDVVNGYYGLLCEFVQCDSKLDTAIDVAAGKNLVHHVVQSKACAEVILREFNARKLRGEVNFLPIDSLKVINAPQLKGLQGAVPLETLIELQDQFKAVSNFVFGRTLLCDTFETATTMMRTHMVQCVTLDGDKVSKVGVMTGGYKSKRPQKLELQRARSIEIQEMAILSDKKQSLDHESTNLKKEYELLRKENEKFTLQKARIMEEKRSFLIDIETAEKKVRSIKESLKVQGESILDLKASISVLQEQANISANCDDKIQIIKDLRTIINRHTEAEKQYNSKLSERNAVDVKLKNLLKIYYAQLGASAPNVQFDNQMETTRISELITSLSKRLNEVQKKFDVTIKEATCLQKKVLKYNTQLNELTQKENESNQTLQRNCDELDSFATKHAHWFKKLEKQKAEGTKLGSLPVNLDTFENLSERELSRKLEKLNAKLKDSVKVGINQKAVQQYDELREKCNAFEKRMNMLLDDRNHLLGFLKDLKARKGEAMLQNVRLIQQQFQNFFCEIVPQGNAALVFYGDKNNVSIDHNLNIDDERLRMAAGDNLLEGVSVLVNFIGKQLHATRSLAQLSGGQKSVIALCLILAIQTIDPAPFYLFDEVDQALDTAYRDAVARLIGHMSDRSQFICTTFRKELVAVADKIYGVSFENRCSYVQPVTERQALSFVENEYSMDSDTILPSRSFCDGNVSA